MPKYMHLFPDDDTKSPIRVKRATYRAVLLNIVAFLLLGFISVFRELDEIKLGARVADSIVVSFFLLTPVWLVGAYVGWNFLRLRRPSISAALWFALKGILGLAVAVAFLNSTQSDGGANSLADVLIAIGVFALAISCFIAFGFFNGYFGMTCAIWNLLLLIIKLHDETRVDALMWFNLLGLISIDSSFYQWSLMIVSFFLSLSERTFSVLESATN